MKTYFFLKTNLFVLAMILFFNLNAQYPSNSKPASSIDIIIGGDVGFRLIDNNFPNSILEAQAKNREDFERQKFNYRFGLNYYHGLRGNLKIKTGIRYANPGFTTLLIEPIEVTQNINTIKKIRVLNRRGFHYRYKYQFIELPLGINYTLANSYCKPYVEIGIAPSYYWKTIVEKESSEGISRRTSVNENINRLNFIAFFATGGNFDISPQISGFTQLVVRYQINDLRKDGPGEKIVSLGFEVGVRYYLN